MRPFAVLRMRNPVVFIPTTPIDPSTKSPSLLYDVSDISTLFQDTAGTTPVTTAGQSVARVNDKSGNGKNLTQTTSTKQPTYQVDSSGYPYLLFDGIDDSLSVTFTPVMPFDEVIAAQVVTWAGGKYLLSGAQGGSSSIQTFGTSPQQYRVMDSITPPTNVVVNAQSSGPAVITARHIANASKIQLNEGAAATGDAGAGVAMTSIIVGGSNGAGWCNMRFYGMTTKNSQFADADLPGIIAWLGAKAGLTL